MALKGQKFNKYSAEIKNIILEELKNGYSCRFLSRKYNISEKTISTWQQKIWAHILVSSFTELYGAKIQKIAKRCPLLCDFASKKSFSHFCVTRGYL